MGSMGRKQRYECSGAWLDDGALYQVGVAFVKLSKWPMGQWELGLQHPAENLRVLNGGDPERKDN